MSTSLTSVRVRFAPSPTGFLHIGGVRTALYCWLYAKKYGGKFLLRIEDTDLERSETRYTDDILASLKWFGLTWDEELVYQSKRLGEHRARAEEMVAKGLAYRCTCTEAEVEKMREKATAEGRKPMYDRSCRERKDVAKDATHVIRAKLPLDGYIEFDDLIRGPIRFENKDLDDFVIVRTSGAPTYNLSVVVDDVDMKMTHIIRGDDHINNTPKQMHLYRAMNYPVPKFAHLPMILGADKKKLSKRHGDVSASQYRTEGYLPEALLNFLVRLGWSHGDQEIFSIEEMCQYFDFDHVQKSAAVFNLEKLQWLNGAHIRQTSPARLAKIVSEDFASVFSPSPLAGSSAPALARAISPRGEKIISLIQPKVKTVKELAEQLVPLCTSGVLTVDTSGLKWNKDANLKTVTQNAVQHAVDLMARRLGTSVEGAVAELGVGDEAWGSGASLQDVGLSPQEIDALLRQIGEQHGVKLGDLTQPMRLAVTGALVSAGLFELLSLLPWELVESRLRSISTW